MKNGQKLDGYDISILRALQQNGRMTKKALADAVNLTPSPCWERLKRLEDAGYISGYQAQIDIRKIAPVTEVLVEVTLAGHSSQDFQWFEREILERSEVNDCWAIGGGIDYIMHISVRDVDEYQQFMDELLDSKIGIERYFGYIVTKAVKSVPPTVPDV